MTDKDLISKLNSLKNINPDADWKAGNRDLLLSQICNSGARELSAWKVLLINFNSVAKAAARPAYALGVFVVMLITGSLFSHQVFSSAKPNDSLYIARIISEKAKLNTMFNSDERNKLAVQFATEHAQDISAVLADPKFNNEENKDQVAKLNENFDKEIDTVKAKIGYLKLDAAKVAKNSGNEIKASTSDTVLIADSSKNKEGIQIYNEKDLQSEIKQVVKATSATGTIAETATLNPEKKTTDSILDEAKQLFENKDYSKASDKVKEVEELIK